MSSDVISSTLPFETFIKIYYYLSRQAGHRFGEHVERVTPLIEKYSRQDDDELREYCLQVC